MGCAIGCIFIQQAGATLRKKTWHRFFPMKFIFSAVNVAIPLFSLAVRGVSSDERATVTLIGANSYGRALESCRVRMFASLGGPERVDFASSFKGLVSTEIPYGEYTAYLACAGDTGAGSTVRVDRPDQLLVISSHRHIADYYPGLEPRFKITLRNPPAHTTVWAKLVGVYLNDVDIEPFRGPTHTAFFIQPQPGRYMLMILAPNRLICTTDLITKAQSGSVDLRIEGDRCVVGTSK